MDFLSNLCSLISLRILIQIESISIPWTYLRVLFLKLLISNFSTKFSSDLIKFEEHLKNTLILCGFDFYSPLYSLICDYNLKLVSLEILLTHLRVFSMTTRICLVSN